MSIEPLWSIEPEIRQLLPVFLNRGRERVAEMRMLLDRRDFVRLRQLGHGLKGSGAMYDLSGFRQLGEQIEEAARSMDRERVEPLLRRLIDLLNALEFALQRDQNE